MQTLFLALILSVSIVCSVVIQLVQQRALLCEQQKQGEQEYSTHTEQGLGVETDCMMHEHGC